MLLRFCSCQTVILVLTKVFHSVLAIPWFEAVLEVGGGHTLNRLFGIWIWLAQVVELLLHICSMYINTVWIVEDIMEEA